MRKHYFTGVAVWVGASFSKVVPNLGTNSIQRVSKNNLQGHEMIISSTKDIFPL